MKRNTPNHPKLAKLAAELKIRKYAAAGLLELLWHMTAQYAPEGDIGRFQDSEISLQLDWLGDPPRLIKALVDSQWLDRHPTKRLIVHHWSDHSDAACDKYLSDSGRCYADGKPPRRKGEKPLLNETSETESRDKSRQVTTSHRKSRLPKPIPIPKPIPKPLAVAASEEAAPTTDLLAQVQRIKKIRKEFEGLRDVDIENALKDVPAECREAAIHDFERDMVAALTVPDMPVKKLRAYLDVAARENTPDDGGDLPRDTAEVTERAYQALADAKTRADEARAAKTPCVATAAMQGKGKGKHGRK